MYYQDLIDCFNNEFGSFAQLTVMDTPDKVASKGYALNSLRMTQGSYKSAVGIDIGNATTVVTNLTDPGNVGF